MRKKVLMRFFPLALCLLLLLTGCEQPGPGIGSMQVSPSQAPPSSNLPVSQKSGKTAFVFDASIIDPQNMAPTFEPGVCKVLAAFLKEADGYSGDVEITRKFPQGYDEASQKKQPDGYIVLSYKSTFSHPSPGEVRTEAKVALDKLAENDMGQRFYGTLLTLVRQEQYTVTSTFDFGIPYNFLKKNAGVQEIPYLLSVTDNHAKLYLYFHKLSVTAVEGEMKNPPAASLLPAKTDSAYLSINAKALSPEAKKLQDRWQMLFLGKKDGDSFAGNLYLSRIEEKVGAYPGVASLTGNCSVYETPLQLHFLPFDEAAYRKAGGHMGSMQTSSLSHMAAVNCEGNNLLFTAAGDTVFVELPGSSFGGVLEGKLTGSGGQTERVYEESLALCRAEYAYSTAPQPEGSDNWTEAARQGTQMTGITLTEDALNRIAGASGFATELEGQCLWLPNGFIPLTAPFDCYEQNVLTNPTFSYTEDGLWLDKIGPLYRQHFSGMRDFSVKEGEYGGHYSMEIVFSYGVKTIYIELCDGNAGTDVTVMMFGQ